MFKKFENTLISINYFGVMSLKLPTPKSINHPNYDLFTIQRLMEHSKEEGDCLECTFHTSWNGYPIIRYRNQDWRVNRLAYVLLGKKPLTPGMVIDHLCRNRRCFKTDHLEEVTHEENLHRGREFRHAQKLENVRNVNWSGNLVYNNAD